MIPKTIHYCWFGGRKKPKLAKKSIASWQNNCPDYEIREWNEENFPLADCPRYIREAYAAGKYAYVSDYARLKVLFDFGGFYMDTDVELLGSLDRFLQDRAVIGFENDSFVNSGQLLGAEAGHPILAQMMGRYENLEFCRPDGKPFLLGCPHVNTQVLEEHGLLKNGREQLVADVHVYPADWFNPLDSTTGLLNQTENTVSIHHYAMSWLHPARRLRVRLLRRLRRLLRT